MQTSWPNLHEHGTNSVISEAHVTVLAAPDVVKCGALQLRHIAITFPE